MFRSYFKTCLRNLWKNKTYNFLNIFGLAIGITCAALIFLWVEDEWNFNSNNLKKDSLYIVMVNDDVDAGVFTHSSTPGLMGPSLLSEFPGIANSARTTEGTTSALFTIGNNPVYASGKYADPSIFSMFTLPFIQGSSKTAFSQLYSIVITDKTRKKFFGDEQNVIGKTIRVNNEQDYMVTGVIKDLPQNSSLQFEWLAPFQIQFQKYPGYRRWTNFGTSTYIELKPGVQASSVNKFLQDYIQKKQGSETSTVHLFLFGMNNWRLHDEFENGKSTGGGRIQYVHLFSIIAWIILVIACINFMNLATARSEKRAREVGVRKVLGSGKRRLVFQFIGESVLMTLLASFAAIFFISLLLPAFNTLVQKDLSMHLSNPVHFITLASLTIICGLLAGSYPSLYLSSFNPVFVLKGLKLKSGSAAFIRKGLVVMQFSISIVLIIGTIIIYQQIQHIKSRDLGYNKNNLLQISAQGDVVKNFPAIRQDLINTGMVAEASLADHETISGGNNTSSINWQGKKPNSIIVISQRLVSEEFISTTGLKLLEGRDFQQTDRVEFKENHMLKDSNQAFNVIITASLEKLLGEGSAIGKTLQRQTDEATFQMKVVGVVKDYVYGNMYGHSDPVIFYDIPQEASLLYVRTKEKASIENVLLKIESVMKKDNPAFPFEYKFVDEQFNDQFLSETLISKLSRIFALLAIIISCLGLFGLAAYTAERRKKEIGIRKVLGATVTGITRLLSKDFLKLVTVSCIVAFPVAWWMMKNWLQNYQYRIEISWWVFLVAGILAILISLLTISFQSIKAAIANPIKNLRTE